MTWLLGFLAGLVVGAVATLCVGVMLISKDAEHW